MSDLEAQAEGFSQWLATRLPEGGTIGNREYAAYVFFCMDNHHPVLTHGRWARVMSHALGQSKVVAQDGQTVRTREIPQEVAMAATDDAQRVVEGSS